MANSGYNPGVALMHGYFIVEQDEQCNLQGRYGKAHSLATVTLGNIFCEGWRNPVRVVKH